jgi:hypothetical protein
MMTVHDQGTTLHSKRIRVPADFWMFKAYNPRHTTKALGCTIAANVAPTCQISVYTDAEQIQIVMIRPSAIHNALSSRSHVIDVAQEVDTTISTTINDAALRTEPTSLSSSQTIES